MTHDLSCTRLHTVIYVNQEPRHTLNQTEYLNLLLIIGIEI